MDNYSIHKKRKPESLYQVAIYKRGINDAYEVIFPFIYHCRTALIDGYKENLQQHLKEKIPLIFIANRSQLGIRKC